MMSDALDDKGSMMFPLVAGTIFAVGVVGILAALIHLARFARAPVRRLVAVVVDEREKVTGGGKDSSSQTKYYATLSTRDGKRQEVETTGRIAGQITNGDIGVALLRMNKLVAFHRS